MTRPALAASGEWAERLPEWDDLSLRGVPAIVGEGGKAGARKTKRGMPHRGDAEKMGRRQCNGVDRPF